jgi:hypothetical protein
MDEDKPVDTDVVTETADESIESIFEETGDTDVEGKSEGADMSTLSLDDINSVLKREFKTKEEALKSLDGLKRLVGDQDLAKERKEKKTETKSDVDERIARLEKQLEVKDFLLEVPTAKEHLELVEAYAEKQGITLSEAWNSKFAKFAESSQTKGEQGKTVINKNRITPVQSQRISSLAEQARKGDSQAQDALINELIWKK